MGFQLGVAIRITGEDGTVAFLNDDTQPEFVGFLSEAAGLDMPPLRGSMENIPEGDGGIAGRSYLSPRAFTLNGMVIDPAPTARSQKMERLERASLALRGDGTMRWTEQGSALERALWWRTTSELRYTGKTTKEFQVGLTAPDPLIQSWVEHTVSDAAGALDIAAGSIVNAGSFPAWPRLRVYGPFSGALQIKNETTGLLVKFLAGLSLAGAGNWVEINTHPRIRTAVTDAGTNVYGLLDFAATTWPNISAVLTGNRFTASLGSRLDVFWRDAWIG